MKQQKESIIEKLGKLDRRVIWWVLTISIIVVWLNPIGLPMSISTPTREFYDFIEELPSDAIVIYSVDYNVASYPSMSSPSLAVLRHLLKLKQTTKPELKIIFLGIAYPDTGAVLNLLYKETNIQDSLVYGTDYIDLGYRPGRELVVASLGQDIAETFPVDRLQGKEAESWPIFDNAKDANDIDLVVTIAGSPAMEWWARQYCEPYDVPAVGACSGGIYPSYSWVYPEYMKGLLNELRGGAEYELLLGISGMGVKSQDVMSVVHLVMIFFIILQNISFVWERMQIKDNLGGK